MFEPPSLPRFPVDLRINPVRMLDFDPVAPAAPVFQLKPLLWDAPFLAASQHLQRSMRLKAKSAQRYTLWPSFSKVPRAIWGCWIAVKPLLAMGRVTGPINLVSYIHSRGVIEDFWPIPRYPSMFKRQELLQLWRCSPLEKALSQLQLPLWTVLRSLVHFGHKFFRVNTWSVLKWPGHAIERAVCRTSPPKRWAIWLLRAFYSNSSFWFNLMLRGVPHWRDRSTYMYFIFIFIYSESHYLPSYAKFPLTHGCHFLPATKPMQLMDLETAGLSTASWAGQWPNHH